MAEPVLDVRDLVVRYGGQSSASPAVGGVNFQVAPGEVVGIIGESGSGKSTIAYAALGWSPGAHVSGSIRLGGSEVVGASPKQLRRLRGSAISLVPQDPMKSLNPSMRIGDQVAEQLTVHGGTGDTPVRDRVTALLAQVRLPQPADVARRFPYELSGGQQQRVLIAMALSCRPSLIVMDEPTTGLDVTTAAHILDLVRQLRREFGCALLFISHDLSVVARVTDRVLVMRDGMVVESGGVRDVLTAPEHEYTRRLLAAIPRRREVAAGAEPAPDAVPALSADALAKDYRRPARRGDGAPALAGGSFVLAPGRTLCVVGESGSGKTTLARVVAGLVRPDGGRVALHGRDLPISVRHRSRADRRSVQFVFQNPDASLNPRHTVGAILQRPLQLFGLCPRAELRHRVAELLEAVQLPASFAARMPRELSGGQKQRVAIARAFAAEPEVVICDEPTSALDVSVQDAILQLLVRLQRESNVSYLFITHDLNVVQALGGDAMVMRHGVCVERGPVEQIFGEPRHEYTRALVAAAPTLDDVFGMTA